MTPSPTSAQSHAAIAYGYRWQSSFPLSLFRSNELHDGPSDITVSLAAAPAPPRHITLERGRLRICADGLRFLDDTGTVLDLYGTDRIDVIPGAEWAGDPPASLYGTVTAAMLASRGRLIMHGSAVEVNGRAILICGSSGAGKSTLAASLVAAGGRLLSDDLSAIQAEPAGSPPAMYAGRQAMRLFPEVASQLAAAVSTHSLSIGPKGKALVRVPQADPMKPWTLAAVLLLGPARTFTGEEVALLTLMEHSYRRRGLRHLPQRALRLTTARAVAAQIPILAFPPVDARHEGSFQRMAQEALRACDRALA